MTPEELIAAVEEGNPPVIVVIRSPRQFRDGHWSGAISISLQSDHFFQAEYEFRQCVLTSVKRGEL
jgi:hypothetical protein